MIQPNRMIEGFDCPVCHEPIIMGIWNRWNGWEVELSCEKCGSHGGSRIEGFGGSTAREEYKKEHFTEDDDE